MQKKHLSPEDEIGSGEEKISDQDESITTEDLRRSMSAGGKEATIIPPSAFLSKMVDLTTERTPSTNDDDMAELMAKLISQKAGLNMWGALAERAGTLASIAWLASHVPSCVLARVSEETQRWDEGNRHPKVFLSSSSNNEHSGNLIDSLDEDSLSDLSYSDGPESISSDSSESSSLSSESSASTGAEDFEDIGLDLDAVDEDPKEPAALLLPHSRQRRSSRTSLGIHSMGRVSFAGSRYSSQTSKGIQSIGKASVAASKESGRLSCPESKYRAQPKAALTKCKTWSDFSHLFPAQWRATSTGRSVARSTTRSTARITRRGLSTLGESDDSSAVKKARVLGAAHTFAKGATNGEHAALFNHSFSNDDESNHYKGQHRSPKRESFTSRRARRDSLVAGHWETRTGMMSHGRKEEDIGQFKRSQNSSGNLSSLAKSRSRWRGSKCSKESTDFFPDDVDLPYASKHQSALLFIDISGFTSLSTLLDPESLSKAINVYFHQIVDLVTSQGGDILKFAGDAVFAEWKTMSDESKHDENQVTMDHCVCAAATCAASIVAQCSDFPVSSQGIGTGAQVATLNVHCGLGVGEIVGLHLGDHETRREYIVLGDPIDQVAEAEGAANLGEVAASPKFLAAMAKSCRMEGGVASVANHIDRPVVIARRGIAFFTVNRNHCLSLESRVDKWACRGVLRYTKNWNGDVLERYRKLLSLYAHPVVVANESAAVKNPQLKSTAEERQREEAELRSVYVMFITPLISVRVTGNNEIDCANFQRLNNILNVTTRELSRFSGHLRQFIVDDKGVVLIATFGLRGSTFPNMVAERALPATIVIHRVLQSELGVQNRIGATVGKCYCGVVGGLLRHEYAVLGPSVNLAARLMASPKNPGVLVDENVRMLANRTFGFDALSPVVAKGYIDPVPIYEPLNPLERGWGRAKQNFVGRRVEITKSTQLARTLAMAPLPARMMFLTGDSGMGKTTTVVHAIEHIRTILRPTRRRLIITKHVSKDSDQLVPFSMFGSILLDVLDHFETCSDEGSIVSQEGGRSYCNRANSNRSSSRMQDSINSSSDAFSFIGKHSAVVDRLRAICEDMDAPPEFAEIVSQHLQLVTGINTPVQDKNLRSNKKATASSSLVSFMAKAFLRCTEDSNLVLIALDDVHQTDEMSWKVIQELFETGTKLLIFCTSRPLSTYKLAVDEVFWSDLNNNYEKKGRFVKFNLEPLSREEVLSMVAMTVNVHEDEVSADVLHDVYTQSGGMPQYVNELIETAKRRHSVHVVQKGNCSRTRRNSIDHLGKTTVYESLGQLILSRLDNLDANVRNILNLGAVLGVTFELTEVVDVLRQMYVEPQTKSQFVRVNQTKIALDVAVKEGVLHVVYSGGETIQPSCIPRSASQCAFNNGVKESSSGSESPVDRLTYSFCHDIWRSTILKLMLSSRKRDIHKTIAETLESQQNGNAKDYISRMKLFSHWRASGDFIKAAELALSIGNRFEVLGLNNHRIRLADEAMTMWEESDSLECEPRVLSRQVLESASVAEVEYMIKLEITLGKANANIHKAAESVKAYQTALRILEESLVAEEMKDRSIVFPIFSGLFIALKLGMIKQDPDLSFEKSLAARFVKETKSHGDPVHFLRALAMEAEIYGRLGEFDLAFKAKREMERIYDPDKHTHAISQIYGSDRTAQAIGLSSLWYYQTGRMKEALHNCDRVMSFVLPRMDIHNVHNSFLIIIPSLWVMKENGLAHEAAINFEKYVAEPFHLFYPEGAFTYFLPVFKPIAMLLDLASYSEIENQRAPDFNDYLEWALKEANLRPSSIMNSMGVLGRVPGTITSEICLLLAEKLEHGPDRMTLVKSGLAVASEALDYLAMNEMVSAEKSTQAIYDKLKQLDMTPRYGCR